MIRKILLLLAGLILVTVVAGSWWILQTVGRTSGTDTTPVTFVVGQGEGIRTISADLYRQKFIPSQQAWTLYVLLSGMKSNLQAGTYSINHAMSGRAIAAAFGAGEVDNGEVKVTIKEGETAKVIAAALEKAGIVNASAFLAAIGEGSGPMTVDVSGYDFLNGKPPAAGLEGFLFPDTYRFFKNSAPELVARKFLDNFGRKYTSALRAAAAAKGRTTFQTVTMASILEAELQKPADRAMAADIFWRRFDNNIGLNADTTVLYGLRKAGSTLTADELKIDTPYNTYLHRGLPAGPIGNPGLSSLTAAANPQANEYWYYLTAPSGETIWSKTLEEHNANKAKYLK